MTIALAPAPPASAAMYVTRGLTVGWVGSACRLVVERVPLHLPVPHVTAHEILLVAQKNAVTETRRGRGGAGGCNWKRDRIR